jgi:phenylacetate-CoA ligase
MFEAAFSQLRFAASLVFGIRFNISSLQRLIHTIKETEKEFGRNQNEKINLVDTMMLDAESIKDIQLRKFKKAVTFALKETHYYQNCWSSPILQVGKLTAEDVIKLPLTSKYDLQTNPSAFLSKKSIPVLRFGTTGTTGKSTDIFFSAYELEVMAALSAISALGSGNPSPEDVVQINSLSRGSIGTHRFISCCKHVGALCYDTGFIDPHLSLTSLTKEHHIPAKKSKVSILVTTPSYLGELIEGGNIVGYSPNDFGLKRIILGGEIATEGLKKRCRMLFGEVEITDNYGITELMPLGGMQCEEGHLHFEPSQGLVEVVGVHTRLPALPGEVGTLVATPFPPYRDTTLLLRYNTEDLVKALPHSLTCSLRNFPATSAVLGKLRLCYQTKEGNWIFQRTILEALEANLHIPLPARYAVQYTSEGVKLQIVTKQESEKIKEIIIEDLHHAGIHVQSLSLVTDQSKLVNPIRLRCDLRESFFNC